jgi:CHASE3 domain sensor protein
MDGSHLEWICKKETMKKTLTPNEKKQATRQLLFRVVFYVILGTVSYLIIANSKEKIQESNHRFTFEKR